MSSPKPQIVRRASDVLIGSPSGRLDLALKLASAAGVERYSSAGRYRDVRVYAVTGERVR